jgi:hypothetical protein
VLVAAFVAYSASILGRAMLICEAACVNVPGDFAELAFASTAAWHLALLVCCSWVMVRSRTQP